MFAQCDLCGEGDCDCEYTDKQELEQIQSDCDHDWEYFDSEGFKQCTYVECQKKQKI